MPTKILDIIPPLIERGLYCNHLVRPSIRSQFRSKYLSFYWKKLFYIWYMALAWWLVPCLPFPGLPHIYFLFTVRLRIFHVCRNENFRNSYLSFYRKKWFYIWYMDIFLQIIWGGIYITDGRTRRKPSIILWSVR